ncbi:MAG: hypothetical protein OER88_06430 [Planctomycetota bacterium]|nr:hypothetical protein [Planctomycetota bacterium]
MSDRSDPLVPILGSAVSIVVVASIVFVFYPRLARFWDDEDRPVVTAPIDGAASVPVWIARADGVVLVLTPCGDTRDTKVLGRALQGGPYHYLTLGIYHFDGKDSYRLEVPVGGLSSPEGGAAAVPAAALVRPDAPAALRPILAGLGAVTGLDVGPGHRGKILLAVASDPSRRTAFVSGDLRLERREVTRQTLAGWQRRPTLKEIETWW